MPTDNRGRVFLTGASGFVGKHLHPALIAAGWDVMGGTRRVDAEKRRDPLGRYGYIDLGEPASVVAALGGMTHAVYLVHSMGSESGYAEAERRYAKTFARAAAAAGVRRIVYLGAIPPSGPISRHLESRLETGRILREGSVPVVELEATMIVGGGSESFRIVRDLAARLPFMLLPSWLKSESEPVAITDVVAALVHALSMAIEGSAVFTAPGPERLTGRDAIMRTARLLGQKPRVVDIPLVTPRLSSYWIRLVTRANPAVASELVEGLRSDIVAHGAEIWSTMPGFERTPFDAAVRTALEEEIRTLPIATRMTERLLHALAPAAPRTADRGA